jgi:hypothetical protein
LLLGKEQVKDMKDKRVRRDQEVAYCEVRQRLKKELATAQLKQEEQHRRRPALTKI